MMERKMERKLVWMAPFALRDLRKAEREAKTLYATFITATSGGTERSG